MGITGFGFTLDNGREVSYGSDEFTEKMPVSHGMIRAIREDNSIENIVSQLATAVMRLEARGVEFDE